MKKITAKPKRAAATRWKRFPPKSASFKTKRELEAHLLKGFASGAKLMTPARWSQITARLVTRFKTYSLQRARSQFDKLLADVAAGCVIEITKRGKAVASMLSSAKLETLEIMANPEAMKAIRADKAGKLKFSPLPAAMPGPARKKPWRAKKPGNPADYGDLQSPVMESAAAPRSPRRKARR